MIRVDEMQTTEVPVLVVGGGVVGLSASMILSTLGVTSLLVNNYPSTSPHPKAHILNQRTMEILRDVEEVAIVQFNDSDVVRHPLVARIIRAYASAIGAKPEGAGR